MSIKKWDQDMPTLPSLFGNLLGSNIFDMTNFTSPGSTLPAVNIKERKDDFCVQLAAPGMQKEDFKIELENNILSISSEKEVSTEEKDEDRDFTRKEFSYSSFQRSFTLPKSAQEENISASYKNGVLEVIIPKKEEAKQRPARKIDIN